MSLDMESFMVCEVAMDRGIPFVALRAVVDTVETDLPLLVGQIGKSPSSRKWITALKYIAKHPWDIRSLIRLGKAASRAKRTITGFFVEFSRQYEERGELESLEPATGGA